MDDIGRGMDQSELLNPMTYGAKGKKDKSSLGMFGFAVSKTSLGNDVIQV